MIELILRISNDGDDEMLTRVSRRCRVGLSETQDTSPETHVGERRKIVASSVTNRP
jgi:hypothetical protein